MYKATYKTGSSAQSDSPPAARIPTSVRIAIAAFGLSLGLGALSQALLMAFAAFSMESAIVVGVNLVVSTLVILGLVRAHRLAWQWGRITGAMTIVYLAISLLAASTALEAAVKVFLLVDVLVGVVALGSVTARRYFRLYCPRCHRRTSAAADFLFHEAKCASCGIHWP